MRPGVILLVCCCLVPATRGLGPLALERGWAKIDIAGYIERFLNAVGEYYEVTLLELKTKVRDDFTIMEKAPTKKAFKSTTLC